MGAKQHHQATADFDAIADQHHLALGEGPVVKAPSTAEHQRFIEKNWQALQQLGLFERYASLKAAKEAAEASIAAAKAEAKAAAGAVKQSEAAEKQAREAVKAQERLRETAVRRTGVAAKELPEPAPVAKSAAERAAEAQKRLAGEQKAVESQAKEATKKAEEFTGEAETAEQSAQNIRDLVKKLSQGSPDEAAKTATGIVEHMRKRGMLSTEDYDSILNHIQDVKDKYGATEKARSQLKTIFKWLGIGAIAGAGFDVGKHFVP